MPSILNLKFKGNKSFVAFSNLNGTESLTKTWKVCTKVASYLEQGQRLENLSWRLWHLQNLMVDTDNAKSKREFKKLSKCMGDRLDKEKGRSIEELEAPDFKRNHSTDMIRQRAVEKERNREASQNAKPGTIKRMQFTFSVDQPAPAAPNYPLKKPDLKPSPEFNKRTRASRSQADEDHDMSAVDEEANDKDPPHKSGPLSPSSQSAQSQSLRFPALFSNDFGPTALLYAAPTLTTSMNYGEGLNSSASNDSFSISRPTIELPLDDILHNMDSSDSPAATHLDQFFAAAAHQFQQQLPDDSNSDSNMGVQATPQHQQQQSHQQQQQQQQQQFQYHHHQDIMMKSLPTPTSNKKPASLVPAHASDADSSNGSDSEDDEPSASAAPPILAGTKRSASGLRVIPPLSAAVREILPETVSPSKVNPLYGTRANTPTARPTLTVRTQATPTTRSSGPGATATSLNPAVLRNSSGGGSNSAPGGVKAECSNCGATHTPLWRRGLNDELNCNACGLYCKLHKRPRPKSMRNTHGEGRAQAAPRQETVDVMGSSQCYNCHTTATPLWRKDDEGKTVCNACGLYYKLHGSARPISMKSDVIRKRSRHDARRGNGMEDTPSASPGVSRRASPVPEASPTLAPDSTTQMSYEYNEEIEFRNTQSELLGALGQDHQQTQMFPSAFQFQFPGPYHPDYLVQIYNMPSDALPFSSVESNEIDLTMSPRNNKRRRMSTDSASEPPSSAVSYSSFNDGYSSASSQTSHSQRSSMDFPFSSFHTGPFNSGPALRGSGNTFWHPPMMPQAENSPHVFHPPMLPPAEESPMDYLHPPMATDDDSLFSTYLHPPMAIPDDSNNHMNKHMNDSHMNDSHMNDNHMNDNHHNMYAGDYSNAHDVYDAMRVYG